MAPRVRSYTSYGSRLERWLALPSARWRRRSEPQSHGVPANPTGDGSAPQPSAAPEDPVRSTVLVTVLGLSGRALEEVLELVTKQAETTPIAPVFITDVLDFGAFRRRRLRFEYLPDRDRQQRFAPELDWEIYFRRRYAQLRDKWQANSVISFGRAPPRACVVDRRLASGPKRSEAPKGEQ